MAAWLVGGSGLNCKAAHWPEWSPELAQGLEGPGGLASGTTVVRGCQLLRAAAGEVGTPGPQGGQLLEAEGQ